MAGNLTETSNFDANVPKVSDLEDITVPLLNAAPQALADRTRFLKDTLDAHTGAAAPHSGHVSHSLATAINDFLVASSAGQFVKKTVAEIKTILGLGNAAYANMGTLSTQVAAGDHGHANNSNIGGPYQPSATAINTSNIAVQNVNNADTVDGFHASQTPEANQIVVLDANGNLRMGTARAITKNTWTLYLDSMDRVYGGINAADFPGLNANAYVDNSQVWQRSDSGRNSASLSIYGPTKTLEYKTANAGSGPIVWSGPYSVWHSGNTGLGSSPTNGIDAKYLGGQLPATFATAAQGAKADAALPANAQAVDSAKLAGSPASAFALASGFAAYLGPNGYQKLPSGLMLQWGIEASFHDIVQGQISSIAFATSFTACFTVLVSMVGGNGTAVIVTARDITSSGFNAVFDEWAGAVQSVKVTYLAIGY